MVLIIDDMRRSAVGNVVLILFSFDVFHRLIRRYDEFVAHDQPTATAYHEAGHAVVALALERPVHQVSIVPKQQFLGLCRFQKGVTRSCDDIVEREIMIALAGLAAEARHTGEYDRQGAMRDLIVVRELAKSRVGERQIDRYERRMLSKTENLLADEAHWEAVELIAAELLKLGTISGRAAQHLFEITLKKYE